MPSQNPGINYDKSMVENVYINQPAVENFVKILSIRKTVKKEWQVAWLLRAVTCLDLTTLSGDDCLSNVQRLCFKAINPIDRNLLEKIGFEKKDMRVAAVCVYPAQVANCRSILHSVDSNIPIASVATGFPSGQYRLKTRLQEIELAIADGATEIDIVINRNLVLCGKWEELYTEIKSMKIACGDKASMKTILATGELGSLSNVYIASLVCMMAGADFIKTSTGKETVNATLPVGVVMARAIKYYFKATGYKVGLKPAGGIRSAKDALSWQILMKEVLGNDWLSSELFRIGASGLLCDIEKQIFNYVTGYCASTRDFPYL